RRYATTDTTVHPAMHNQASASMPPAATPTMYSARPLVPSRVTGTSSTSAATPISSIVERISHSPLAAATTRHRSAEATAGRRCWRTSEPSTADPSTNAPTHTLSDRTQLDIAGVARTQAVATPAIAPTETPAAAPRSHHRRVVITRSGLRLAQRE